MIKIKKHLKIIAIILCIPLLVQSCSVYRSNTISITEAVNSSDKVKIKDGTNKYHFEYLKEIDGKVYGFIPRNFATAKKLSEQITQVNPEDKFLKIELTENQLKEIYPINRELSVLVSIAVVIAPLSLIAIISKKNSKFYGYRFNL